MKRLIICLDGTWNSAIRIEKQTNIVKLRDMIEPIKVTDSNDTSVAQFIYYDEGVGTDNLYDKIIGGVFGVGLDKNVKQAYRFITNHYELNDEIYIFGFSRGAYTARALGGLIATAGILTKENHTKHNEDFVWNYYRIPKKDRLPSVDVQMDSVRHSFEKLKIHCLGIFDTVGSLGIPSNFFRYFNLKNYQFHDTQLSSIVLHGFHAVAIDEKRRNFDVTLWDKALRVENTNIHQVWFTGAHSDIGGSYKKNDLSNNCLKWMIDRITSSDLKLVFKQNLQPLTYNPNGVLHESRKKIWILSWLIPNIRTMFGIIPKDKRFFRHYSKKSGTYETYREKLHYTVLKRYASDSTYRPENLDAVFKGGKTIDIEGKDSTTYPFQVVNFNTAVTEIEAFLHEKGL